MGNCVVSLSAVTQINQGLMKKPDEQPSAVSLVAQAVQDFYDRYPYPQPVESFDKYRRLWQNPTRRRADYHLYWPARSYREDFTILVAGCGTSQATRHAIRWPKAQVTGIDFSATSVHHTRTLKHKYSLENLQVHQLPLERVSELGRSFDQVICTGVLHHLADPEAGLRSLRNTLAPGGAMHLMMYASYGRAGLYMLQEFCRRVGIQATDEGIRDLKRLLAALPSGHPLENLLRQAADFRQEAELADALLHPLDRAFSVPQLFDLIRKGGMKFGRWIRQAPYLPGCGVLAKVDLSSRTAQLSPEEQFSAIELFRGTMLRHSAILYRDDFPNDPQPVSFNGEAWLSYVPIRIPDTLCVQERLPPGAIAVLINHAHTDRDLFLPIDGTEKRWLDAMDGTSRIGELIKNRTSSSLNTTQLEKARRFFEKLWWYDQVVFDRSI